MTRDEFQQMLDQHGIVFVGDAAWRVAQLVADAEREACAQAALDAPIKTARQDQREACAAAIRARGEP